MGRVALVYQTTDGALASAWDNTARSWVDLPSGDYDAAMQAWAVHDPEAAVTVARVFARRVDFVSSLFREMGHSDAEARTRARLVAALMTFIYTPGAALAPESRKELVLLAHENLTS